MFGFVARQNRHSINDNERHIHLGIIILTRINYVNINAWMRYPFTNASVMFVCWLQLRSFILIIGLKDQKYTIVVLKQKLIQDPNNSKENMRLMNNILS